PVPDNGVREHADGAFTAAEVKAAIESHLRTNGITLVPVGSSAFRAASIPSGALSTLLPVTSREVSPKSMKVSDAGSKVDSAGSKVDSAGSKVDSAGSKVDSAGTEVGGESIKVALESAQVDGKRMK